MVSPRAKGSAIADILAERNGGSLSIVEDDRTLVGLVSEFDQLRVMEEGQDLGQLAATDIMMRDIVTVTEEMPVVRARPSLTWWLDGISSSNT